jgi:hypothetical protein
LASGGFTADIRWCDSVSSRSSHGSRPRHCPSRHPTPSFIDLSQQLSLRGLTGPPLGPCRTLRAKRRGRLPHPDDFPYDIRPTGVVVHFGSGGGPGSAIRTFHRRDPVTAIKHRITRPMAPGWAWLPRQPNVVGEMVTLGKVTMAASLVTYCSGMDGSALDLGMARPGGRNVKTG